MYRCCAGFLLVRSDASSISLDFFELWSIVPTFLDVHSVVSALDDIPAFPISEDEALKFRHGQTLSIASARHRPGLRCYSQMWLQLLCGEQPVALVMVKASELRPVRVFNFDPPFVWKTQRRL